MDLYLNDHSDVIDTGKMTENYFKAYKRLEKEYHDLYMDVEKLMKGLDELKARVKGEFLNLREQKFNDDADPNEIVKLLFKYGEHSVRTAFKDNERVQKIITQTIYG